MKSKKLILSTLSIMICSAFLGFKPACLNPPPGETKSNCYQQYPIEQYCYFDSLSYKFDYLLSADIEDGQLKMIYLRVLSKRDKKVMHLISIDSFDPWISFECSGRSYLTGHNANEEIADGMYGDLVVADFNFDNQEDFAVLIGRGFTHFYLFYTYENATFREDEFLNSNLLGFPQIDNEKRTLSFSSRIGVSGIAEKEFRYDTISKKYILINESFYDLLDDDRY